MSAPTPEERDVTQEFCDRYLPNGSDTYSQSSIVYYIYMDALLAEHSAAAYARGVEDAAKVVNKWRNRDTMLLRAGEMSADERRTAVAIVISIAADVSALLPGTARAGSGE